MSERYFIPPDSEKLLRILNMPNMVRWFYDGDSNELRFLYKCFEVKVFLSPIFIATESKYKLHAYVNWVEIFRDLESDIPTDTDYMKFIKSILHDVGDWSDYLSMYDAELSDICSRE